MLDGNCLNIKPLNISLDSKYNILLIFVGLSTIPKGL